MKSFEVLSFLKMIAVIFFEKIGNISVNLVCSGIMKHYEAFENFMIPTITLVSQDG